MRLRTLKQGTDYTLSTTYLDRQHHHPGLLLTYKGHDMALDAGNADRVTVVRDLDDAHGIYVLTENSRMGYFGLAYYRLDLDDDAAERTSYGYLKSDRDIFLQNPDDDWTGCPTPTDGKSWDDYGHMTKVRHLAEHLGY